MGKLGNSTTSLPLCKFTLELGFCCSTALSLWYQNTFMWFFSFWKKKKQRSYSPISLALLVLKIRGIFWDRIMHPRNFHSSTRCNSSVWAGMWQPWLASWWLLGAPWPVTILLLPPQLLWEGLEEAVPSVFLGNHGCEEWTPPEAMGGTGNNHPWVEMKLAGKLMLSHLPGKPGMYQVPVK